MKRCYTFAVYITADEATDDDGYTQQEVERLLKTTLNHYSAPLNKERKMQRHPTSGEWRGVDVDFELMSSEEVK